MWTSLVFVSLLVLFGFAMLKRTEQEALRQFDQALISRAERFAEGPYPFPPGGFGRGPGPGRGDPLGPRVATADGQMIVPEGSELYSQEMFELCQSGRPTIGNVRFGDRAFRVYSMFVSREGEAGFVVQIAADTHPLRLAAQVQQETMLLALPLALFAGLVVGWLVSGWVGRPVRSVTQLAEAIAAEPMTERRVPVGGPEEMASLGRSINTMADSVQQSLAKTEQALERQRQFTADASHELRTPLTKIMLASESMDRSDPGSAASIINRAAVSMKQLIEGLLAVSRAEAGTTIELWPIELETPVASAVQLFEHDTRLHFVTADAPVPVTANEEAVARIVTNLVANALRESGPQSPVHVRVLTGPARVEVEDHGPGIAAEHAERVFDRFYRVDASRTGSSGGAGLGLAICKNLAEQMGAHMELDSEPGKGSTFRLVFGTISRNSQLPHVDAPN